MQLHVFVRFKNGVLDPEAKAVQNALHALGFSEVAKVEMSKKITLSFHHDDFERAREQAVRMAEELLANLVIQDYEIIKG